MFMPRAAALALATILGGCGADAPEATPENEPAQAPAPDPDAPGVHRIGPNQYRVVMLAFEGGYRPSEIRVPVGSEVTFRVMSEDLVHGFAIEKAGLQIELHPLEFVEAKHTFAEAGEYPFQCHVYCGGGHETMRGRIIVSP
jgi:cytochrome c oxidase subunit 2